MNRFNWAVLGAIAPALAAYSTGAQACASCGCTLTADWLSQGLAAQLIAQQFSTQIAGGVSTSIGANDDGSLRPGLVYNAGDKVIELSTYGATGRANAPGPKVSQPLAVSRVL